MATLASVQQRNLYVATSLDVFNWGNEIMYLFVLQVDLGTVRSIYHVQSLV